MQKVYFCIGGVFFVPLGTPNDQSLLELVV